jgi:apolipoprotein D and lipocalin family protein
MRNFWLTLPFLFLYGCLGYPNSVAPVENFDINRYLGKWYEIARLDHPFERGLEQVSAEYILNKDGGIRVINRGFSEKTQTWKEAEGKGYFVRNRYEGYLKISFFGPFYASYVIFELDKQKYQYAWVTSSDQSYLWFLSRTPVTSKEELQSFIMKSQKLGFNTDQLIFVRH